MITSSHTAQQGKGRGKKVMCGSTHCASCRDAATSSATVIVTRIETRQQWQFEEMCCNHPAAKRTAGLLTGRLLPEGKRDHFPRHEG